MKTIRCRCLQPRLAAGLLAAVSLLTCMTGSYAQSLDDLTFLTEDYPPLNFERRGKCQGIAVDLLEEMLAAGGAAKTRKDMKVWPWARAYETALKEKNTLLFSIMRTEDRAHLFKCVGPIMPSRLVLVAKKTRHIRIGSLTELNCLDLRVGVVREDIGGLLLAKQGVKKEKILQANSGTSVAKMLQAGRVDLWVYGARAALWNLKELAYSASDYEEVYTLADGQYYYFALNRNTDDRLVAKLQAALDELRAKGRVEAVVAGYR